jgi:predicted AlkP superfamily phosphohydrolase/phosphomutase
MRREAPGPAGMRCGGDSPRSVRVCALLAAALAVLALLAGGLTGAWHWGTPTAHAAQAQTRGVERVIILGIDGVDYTLLKDWMDAGQLPNFARLASRGDFKALGTSMPPQSPVAWSNFITGMDSGGHGIFDFIHRDPQTYLPFSSLSSVEPPVEQISFLGLKLRNKIPVPFSDYVLPLAGGTTLNLRQGEPFWNLLTDQGVHAVVHRVPVNFPPSSRGATTLSGMGTPDLQGTNGTYAYYTTNPPPEWENAAGGKIFLVDVIDNVVEERLYGPPNDFIDYDRVKRRTGRTVDYQNKKATIPFKVYIDPEHPVAKVVIGGQEILLKEGEFSPWVAVKFSMLPAPGIIRWAWHDIVSVSGMVRFYLKSAHPDFGLYVTPIQINPADPALPISSPADYAPQLAEELGRFYTQGMPEDTKALEKDVFSNADFMKQAGIIIDEEAAFAERELSRFREGFLFLYFSTIDQIGHVMWRTMRGQEGHPAHDAALDAGFEDIYPALYQELDRIVGRALEVVDDRTVLIVMSDHGFSTWQRAFDLNRWLYENNYLALQPGTAPTSVEYMQGIDWSNTRLYGCGLNGLYVNQLGRERYGIVPPGPAKAELMEQVSRELEAVVDPATGRHPIVTVFQNKDLYSGPLADSGPDAQLGFDVGYRLLDESAIGGMTASILCDNVRRWSGDHCQDYRKVPGVILSNVRIRKPEPRLVDLAPTVLSLFGVTPPQEMKGEPIF